MRSRSWGVMVVAAVPVGAMALMGSGARQDKDALAREAFAVLEKKCSECHGAKTTGGFTFRNYSAMTTKGFVVANEADKSRVYVRAAKDKDMPPSDAKDPTPLTEAEKAALKAWIEAGAPEKPADAPKPDAPPPPPARAPITEAQMLTAIDADLTAANERQRPYLRYFTLTHLYNQGAAPAQISAFEVGLSKLINSLSWKRRIVRPVAIDAEKTIFRVDMRDYDWTDTTWKYLLGAYPYGVTSDSPTAKRIYETTGCPLPYVRADWFVARAAIPPLYHDLLDMPTTADALERKLSVDRAKNVSEERAIRGGVQTPGVSRNNRVVERHESAYGGYWRSFDFSGNAGEQNIFKHPLNFKEAGGEIVFNLPNGLQGYMLVNGQGNRIDIGPTNIVFNRENKEDPQIRNGLTCMSCHVKGMKRFTDDVRTVLAATGKAAADYDFDKAMALYVEKPTMDGLLNEDETSFAGAVAATGAVVSDKEPIVALQARYDATLDVAQAASEVNLSPEAFRSKLASSGKLAGLLGPLRKSDGVLPRDAWEEYYGQVVSEVGGGTYMAPNVVAIPKIPDPAPTPERALETPSRLPEKPNAEINARPISKGFFDLPDSLRSTRFKGDVIVRVTIEANGSHSEELLEGSDNNELDGAVMAYMRHWRWEPAKQDGKPVRSITKVNLPIEVR